MQIYQTVHWSDSTSVLRWIYNRNKEQNKMFVANRIHEILEHSRKPEWRYVSTKEIPADEGTRGLPARKIQDSSWIKGPPFLRLTEEHWPTQPTSIPIPTEPLPNLTSLYCNSNPKPRLINYSWTKILTTTRVIFVVCNKIKNIQQTASEINTTAPIFLLKLSAEEVFPKEIKDLQQRRSVSPKSPKINFSPFLDDANTIRYVQGAGYRMHQFQKTRKLQSFWVHAILLYICSSNTSTKNKDTSELNIYVLFYSSNSG